MSSSWPTPGPVRQLSAISDEDLYNTQRMLALGCGKSKSVLRQERRQYVCFAFGVLKLEADRRGRPSPVPPFSA